MAVESAAGTARELVFSHLPVPWLIPVVFALAALAAWWSWRRYGPPPGEGRKSLAIAARGCRAAALVLLILAVAGPAWRTTATTVLPGKVIVAIDASASMAITDLPGKRPRSAAAADLAAALAASGRALDVEYRLVADGTAGGSPTVAEALPGLIASGPASPLGDDLERLVATRRPDLLILVSDGRITAGSSLAAVAESWRARDLQVAVLATGGEALDPELLIDEVVLNREAALNELEPLTLRLSHRALAPGAIPVRVLVDGVEVWSGEAVQGTTTGAMLGAAEVRAALPFRHPGPAKVTVVAGVDALRVEQTLAVNVRERKLGVLLLEQRPRYETRYLREALKRDQGVTLHAYLSEGRWRRWGDKGPDRLPLNAQDLATYDTVVIGDLGPDAFPAAGLAALEQAVRRDGVGLVWIPGETGAIAGFARTRLGELLPAELPDAGAMARSYLGPSVRLRRTAAATGLGLLDPVRGAWEDLPPLFGACLGLKPKPGAEVLAEDLDGRPLVISRSFGSGRSVLVGVDDTWRWRRNAGDLHLHRFHSQLLRFAGAGHRGDARAWRLALSPRRAAPGEPVIATLAPERPEELVPDAASLRLAGPGGRELIVPLVREGGGFSARFPAPAAGVWALSPAAGVDRDRAEPAELTVVPPADERRDPRADEAGLGAFAARTGGIMNRDAAALVAALPKDLQRLDVRTTTDGLWDTGWLLALVTLLFAVDWALRRLSRLP